MGSTTLSLFARCIYFISLCTLLTKTWLDFWFPDTAIPPPPPHLVTYHFNVGLLTSELEKIPVLKFTKFRERIYVEYLAVSRKNWELDSAHCPPLLHHLFLPHNARMNRGTKQWLSCGSLYIWCSHCFLRLKDMCRLKAFSVPFSSNSQ